MVLTVFKPWPKITRIENARKSEIYTEKIDGTNACVVILPIDIPINDQERDYILFSNDKVVMLAQSRNRFIKIGDDNYGFAEWVVQNSEDLLSLGEGYHFGEWWGQGIGRGYDKKDRVFSLFNTKIWHDENPNRPKCCDVVPTIHANSAQEAIDTLVKFGSLASPSFMNVEGVMVYNYSTDTYLKCIINK